MKKLLYLCVFVLFFFFESNVLLHAETTENVVSSTVEEVYLAKTLSVYGTFQKQIPGTDTTHTYQTIEVEILDGPKKGKNVVIDNDLVMLEKGDSFYLKHSSLPDGKEYYTVVEIYRLLSLRNTTLVLVALIVLLGGMKGVRSLLGLAGSFLAVYFVLFPGILAGYNPILISGILAIILLFFVMYLTHGFTRLTTSAFLGSFSAVLITILFSSYMVAQTKLTGFSDDAAVYLNFDTKGSLNFSGLLISAIIIGLIGVVDDVAITQSAVVSELKKALPHASFFDIWKRAMNIGRDHIGAVVNSLVLAYTGTALPLLLLMYNSHTPLIEFVNKEAVATEVVRTVIGSIGLILAVPITTLIAIYLMRGGENHSHHHHHH